MGEGERNVATSAMWCSAFTGGSSRFTVTAGRSKAGATAVANWAIGVFAPPAVIQSWGGVTIPQTFPAFSNSTTTCCSYRELWEVWTERTLARTAGGLGSTFNPTTCKVIHDPTPYSCREAYRQPCKFRLVAPILSPTGSTRRYWPQD